MSEDSADIVQSGGRPSRIPNWRPSRGAALLGALGLIAGLAAGYAAGDHHAAGQRSAASGAAQPQRPQPSASARQPVIVVNPALIQTTTRCSAQTGANLQLGVQVTNLSGAALTLRRVRAVLPLGGLKVVAQEWAPCGALAVVQDLQAAQGAAAQSGGSLAPGASIWFSVTFKVLMSCPGPVPVQFSVDYTQEGQPVTESLPGFPDLTGVPYTGCAAS